MENKKQRLLTVLWILAAVITRILYFLFKSQTVADTYGYYAHALAGAEEAPVLTSGMAYAYTNHLSKLLPYLENGAETIGLYHLILQILWMVFLIVGMGILFGGIAQFLTGGILMFAPHILESIFVVSPENYFMFCFSLLFLALALFFRRTKKRGWYRSSFCELYLILVGFWIGVICIWNYGSWLLLPIMIHILNKNRYNLKDKIWEQKQKEIYLERQQVMQVGSQTSILTVGILIGMYSTLMKYTGITGDFVGEQFFWWIVQYKDLPERCQDVATQLILWLFLAGMSGILCSMLIQSVQRRKLQNMMYEDEIYPQDEDEEEIIFDKKALKRKEKKEKKREAKEEKKEKKRGTKEEKKVEKKEAKEKEKEAKVKKKEKKETKKEFKEETQKETQYVVTQDGRKVELLDNPLPVPPKHEKRDMDFKFNEFSQEAAVKEDAWDKIDDFDLKGIEKDDFDV